jgi:hypothetical protein
MIQPAEVANDALSPQPRPSHLCLLPTTDLAAVSEPSGTAAQPRRAILFSSSGVAAAASSEGAMPTRTRHSA